MVPAVLAVVPAALPGTCPRQIFLNGNTYPRYCRACGTGRVGLSSTFQATPVTQADEKFNGRKNSICCESSADYNVTSNSQPNGCKMALFVNKNLCRGGGLILFSFIFK